ncbi:hypothetical protein S1OALGB6SA_782 [Olavius algarvensis spirochete endosymbiont]|uniref:NfeD family protein n=1 Tax=Olavius algarvensis spirochete endosymbiont TaxID=260710 RepID=UPI000F12C10B|nr:NfeD family protein [Olavius algarvensis spirochete endosymbiont]VDA99709.1 hypothetical protein S1OALGB6SA_782 [Olavius algarvensis spirochete endosymbiont]
MKLRAIAVCALNLISVSALIAQAEMLPARVYVIPLREDVDRYLGVFLGRSLEEAERAGVETLIIEIDTFGGRVDTALEIASKLGSATWAKTVAYIPVDSGGRGVSWSAGALMAFSCAEIWMAPGTSIGAAAPVYQTTEGIQPAEEKTVSALRGQMAALAEKNGYPVGVALAMVDADVVLKEVIVDDSESLLTETDINAMERKNVQFEIGKTVSDKGKLLTLTAGEMERYEVSAGSALTREELITKLGYTSEETVVVEKSRADSIITFLTSGAMVGLLLIIALIGIYLEITSPGFGVSGTIALIALAIVFVSSGLMGNLAAVEILMLLAGVILLLLEIFIIPGFGIAGIAGIVLILGAFVLSQQNFFWPQFDWQWNIAKRNLAIVGIGIFAGFTLIGVIMALLPRASLFSRLILHGPGDLGYAGKSWRRRNSKQEKRRPKKIGTSKEEKKISVDIGAIGVAVTDLRPVGKVRFESGVIVVETSGEYCEKNTRVIVQSIDGVKAVVSAVEEK